MKLVQKTLLATAVAVACSGSAFADVTLSGKVALEVAGYQNAGNVKDQNDVNFLSDGLSLGVKGAYDIVGNAQAGFKLDTTMSKSTWETGTPVTVDQANVFFKGGWGRLDFGYLTTPSDGVVVDYFDNTNFAASGIDTAKGDVPHAGAYSFEGESFSVAVAMAHASQAKGGDVTAKKLASDIAVSVKAAEGVTVKAGFQYMPTADAKDPNSNRAGKGSLSVEGDFDAFGVALSVTGKNVRPLNKTKDAVSTDLLLGAKYNVSDLITVKGAVTATDLGDGNNDESNPMQYTLGADFNLAKNVVAFAAFNLKDIDAKTVDSGKQDAAKKAIMVKADTETSFGAGVTVKF